MNLLHPVATHLSTRTAERHAARLFYILRAVKGNKRRFSLDEACAAAPDFTRKQVVHSLKTLTKISWVGQDRNGVFHLRGLDFFLKKYGRCNSCLSVEIPATALSSKKSWTDFVYSAMLTAVGRNVMHWTNRKIVDNTVPLRNITADQSVEKDTYIALSVITSLAGLSSAAAYRARKRAGASHLQVQRVWRRNPQWIGLGLGGSSGQELKEWASAVTILDCKRVRGQRPCKSGRAIA